MTDEHAEAFAREMIRASVWASASIRDEPEVKLIRWQVYALPGGRHFVGYNVGRREGRVSTAIRRFDSTTRRGITASGRVYELIGPPDRDADGEWVFGLWLMAQNLSAQDAVVLPPHEFLDG